MYTQTAVESKVRLGLHRVGKVTKGNGRGEEDRVSPHPRRWAVRERPKTGCGDSEG